MDMVVKTDHIPVPGETVLSGSFFMNAGGKGANQAVAVARLGGEVVFISKLGNDLFGKQFSQLFSSEGIDTSHLRFDDERPSGVALITVDKAGENSIVVASGANAYLGDEDIVAALREIETARYRVVAVGNSPHHCAACDRLCGREECKSDTQSCACSKSPCRDVAPDRYPHTQQNRSGYDLRYGSERYRIRWSCSKSHLQYGRFPRHHTSRYQAHKLLV